MHDLAENPAQGTPPNAAAPAADPRQSFDHSACDPRVERACAQACASIAPAWPLDRSIAVNPHWGRIGRPLREVAARMQALAGIQVFPPRAMLRQAWEQQRITPEQLEQALRALPQAVDAGLGPQSCIDALREAPRIQRLPLLIDILDDDPRGHARLSWRQAITHQLSQCCAAYFDRGQADWQPARGEGLYAFWLRSLRHDRGIGLLMGLPRLHHSLHALPATRAQAEAWALQRLGLDEASWADYLEAVLLSIQGWASWCAYLGWDAAQQGRQDSHLRELLAMRLAWGALLLECKDDGAARRAFAAVRAQWSRASVLLQQAQQALLVDEVWQRAYEAGYQHQLLRRLATAGAAPCAQPPQVQAVFCIDVRSEPMRRALEAVWPQVHTLGFAGFFGLTLQYTPLATAATRPQLPGLLAPSLQAVDRMVPAGAASASSLAALDAEAADARLRRFAAEAPWQAAGRWPGAAFSLVEAAGLGYLGKLTRWLLPTTAPRQRDDLDGLPPRYRSICRPLLDGLDASERVELAARVLQAMGLRRDLAPLVLLVGHASQSANNAHAAALDCGACCGQSGEVNARALAQLLNDRLVREGLCARGIDIPGATHFVACLHNTTTDEIDGLDLDLLPQDAQARWQRLQPVLEQAGDQARRARAARLGMDARADARRLLRQLRRRANDGAQTRPEWGLAGNAALLIAPRSRSLGAVLDGRCFLHDYDCGADADGALLEQLMTGPLLVAHWINWQYHASTCDPAHLGAGNKLLHNVVGGNIGVFEGNGGDLRPGLALQSLHDGGRWMHEPLRLSVLIEAPQRLIEQVLGRHQVLRDLVDNGWLHLLCIDSDGSIRQRGGAGHWRVA